MIRINAQAKLRQIHACFQRCLDTDRNATHIIDAEELKMQDANRDASKDEAQNTATQPWISAALGHGSFVPTTVLVLVAASFEPEREFDPVP